MRLNDFEITSIKDCAKKVFGSDVKVILFGSRVDDSQRGGDIDLYIKTSLKNNLLEKKIKFIIDLENKIGEQKIDVVIASSDSRPIEQEALSRGIEL